MEFLLPVRTGTVTKVYVGNLPENCRRQELQAEFEKYGTVEECDVVKNYGFVHLSSEEEAKLAIQHMHNRDFMGSTITVEISHSKVRPKPGMGGKGQCFRCGRQGHWSKECPRGPSRPPALANGFPRARDPYPALPPPPPPPPPATYIYARDRLTAAARYVPDRMRPYPDPYDRRALATAITPRTAIYEVGRRSPHAIDYIYETDPYAPPQRARLANLTYP